MNDSKNWAGTTIPFDHEIPVVFRPGPTPLAPLVVFCHSMGEDPRAWVDSWPRITALPVHCIAPAGPYPFEIRTGETMRIGHAWYLYDGGTERFRATMERSADWLRAVLERTEGEQGWRPARRALVGHSQGAYFGFVAALRNQDLFSHLVAVAGRLKSEFLDDVLRDGGSLRTLILHGESDQAVSPDAAGRSLDILKRAGYRAEVDCLPGGHRLTSAVDARAAGWLAEEGFVS